MATVKTAVARAIGWGKAHGLAAGGATAGLLMIVALFTFFKFSPSDEIRIDETTVAAAVAALDASDFTRAATLANAARQAEQGKLVATEDWGLLYYVLGELAFRDAESDFETHKKPLYAVAASHLEAARDRGFPAARAARGHWLLGQCLYQNGRIADARASLNEALRLEPSEPWYVHRMLAEAYLNDSQPDYPAALEHNTQLLAAGPISPDERHAAKIQRARILYHMGDTAATAKLVAEIPENSTRHCEVLLLEGLLLIDEARGMSQATTTGDVSSDIPIDATQIRATYREAVKVLSRSQAEDSLRSQVTPKAAYLVAVCYYETGQYRAALKRFAHVSELFKLTPEGLSATLYQAEILQQLEQHDTATAAFRRALDMAGGPDTYRNEWIPLDEFRRRIKAAHQFWLHGGEEAAAVELARSVYPMYVRDLSARWEADAQHQWGQSLVESAASLPYTESVAARSEGLEHLRLAGRGYLRSARLRYTSREYPEDLWIAAKYYFAGQGYQQAISVLREYISNEARLHRSESLVDLGEALLATGQPKEAVVMLQECVDLFPHEAPVFRARLLLSRAAIEAGDIKQAKAMLRANLEGSLLAPDSREWRDSLVELGKIEYVHAADATERAEAIRHLKEAVDRAELDRSQRTTPVTTREIEARYLLAQALREQARQRMGESDGVALERHRTQLNRDVVDMFNQSAQHYREIQNALNRRLEATEISPYEEVILRNAYFGHGATLFALADATADIGPREALLGESINVYSEATSRYLHEPASLEGFVRIATAYRRLGKNGEARSALQTARRALSRMNDEALFAQSSNFSRARWEEYLDWSTEL